MRKMIDWEQRYRVQGRAFLVLGELLVTIQQAGSDTLLLSLSGPAADRAGRESTIRVLVRDPNDLESFIAVLEHAVARLKGETD